MKVKASSTHKKVVVERFSGEPVRGYLNPRTFDQPEGMELLTAEGQRTELPWKEIKIAWFVQEWDPSPARPERTMFLRRPRLEGLWIRLRFRDQEVLEGLVANDLLGHSAFGYLITPPDLNGNHQKAFIPRSALAAMEVLAVIPHRGQHRRRRPRGAPAPGQTELFEP